VLERYERWRRLDSALSAATFDALNRLFSNDFPLLRAVRDFGLGLVERLPALKQVFVAEAAGLTGEVPKLLRGEPA
jgi:2-octaprenyl-6-methoxyphenol hydroxylase